MDIKTHILALSAAYQKRTGMGEGRLATHLVNRGSFLASLRSGKSCTLATYSRALQWFADNWPTSCAWPKGVPRPASRRPEGAPKVTALRPRRATARKRVAA